MNTITEKKADLIAACQQAAETGLVTGTSGNASYLHNRIIYITASGTDLGCLNDDDFAEVTLEGETLKGLPSKELSAHRAIYNSHPEINSVFHLHGESLAAWTCIAEPGSSDYPAIGSATPLKVADKLPVVPFSYTNSEGDYEIFLEGARQEPIFCQANHGAFIGAATTKEALTKGAMLEYNMGVYLLALSTGKPVNVLTAQQQTVLHNRDYPTNLAKELIEY